MIAGPDVRERLGRLVHETRQAVTLEQADRRERPTFILPAWEDRTGGQRELDRRIADAIVSAVLGDDGTPPQADDELTAALEAYRAEFQNGGTS